MTTSEHKGVTAFREKMLPLLTNNDLHVLRKAMREDSPELQQRLVCPPVGVGHVRPHKACLISYVGWKSRGCDTVAKVFDFYNPSMCKGGFWKGQYDHLAFCDFLAFFDGQPRNFVFEILVDEIEQELHHRGWVYTEEETEQREKVCVAVRG